MLRDALALMLAVRCGQEEAARQLLARFYQQMTEQQAKTLMIRTIYLLTPSERDWLRDLV
jgi:N-acetylglutamate synthase-like GNAT family acetyltransferase